MDTFKIVFTDGRTRIIKASNFIINEESGVLYFYFKDTVRAGQSYITNEDLIYFCNFNHVKSVEINPKM